MGRIVIFIIFCYLFFGCSTKQTAVLPQVSNHTEARTEFVNIHDTLMQKDSVIIIQRGDTIYHIEKHMIYNPVVRYTERTDTVMQRDTVSVPVYIEKKSTLSDLWKEIKYIIAGVFLCIVVLAALSLYLKFKK